MTDETVEVDGRQMGLFASHESTLSLSPAMLTTSLKLTKCRQRSRYGPYGTNMTTETSIS